jgi:hypothetical protein
MKTKRRQAIHATIAIVSALHPVRRSLPELGSAFRSGCSQGRVAGQAGAVYRGPAPTYSRAQVCLACQPALGSPTSALCGRGAFPVLNRPHTALPRLVFIRRGSCGILPSMSCLLSRGYGAFVGHVRERGAASRVEDPHTKTDGVVLGAGKGGFDMSVLGATCERSGQTGQTPPVPLKKSHLHTAQQQGTDVHVRVHVSAAHPRFDDIALGQRRQCSIRSEKHRENRPSAEYIRPPCRSCRSYSQAQR